MIIQELNHIETAEDIYIEGAAVGQSFFATSVGTGPAAAINFGSAVGTSLAAGLIPPVLSFGFGALPVFGAAIGFFGAGSNIGGTQVITP